MLRSSLRGFTLVEVVVATGILVTIAAGTTQLFAVAIRQSAAARQQLAMSLAASAKIEDVAAAVASADPPVLIAGAIDRAVEGYADVVVQSGAAFERRWIVAPLSSYAPTAVLIAVRVAARGAQGAQPIEVVTIREARTP
jgi:prepilin-type N-terminal cleavage/methylation domain-containing protein